MAANFAVHQTVALALCARRVRASSKPPQTTALTQAGISSPGIVGSFLKASHLKRTRYAHQVTAVALAKLQAEAFAQTDAELSKEIWKERMRDRCPYI